MACQHISKWSYLIKLKETYVNEWLFPQGLEILHSFPFFQSICHEGKNEQELGIFPHCDELGNYYIVNSHCTFALLPTFYLIKAIHLSSQPGYLSEGPVAKGASDNVFFCGSFIGFSWRKKKDQLKLVKDIENWLSWVLKWLH